MIVGQFQPVSGEQEQFGMLFQKGNPLVAVRQRGAGRAHRGRHPRPAPAAVALQRGGRPGPPVSTVSDPGRRATASSSAARYAGGSGVRQTLIAAAVTGRRLRRCCGSACVTSPGWPRVHETFFNGFHARESFDAILHGLLDQREAVPDLRAAASSCSALAIALARTARAPWLLPAAARRGRLHRRLPRHPDDPARRAASRSACRRCGCRASPTARCSGPAWRWSSPTAPTSPRCSAPASTRSTPRRSTARRRSG